MDVTSLEKYTLFFVALATEELRDHDSFFVALYLFMWSMFKSTVFS